MVGKTVIVDYGDIAYSIHFINEFYLTFRGLGDLDDTEETVSYRSVQVTPTMYMITWYECTTSLTVVQVQDLSVMKVYSEIISCKPEVHLKGNMRVING